MTNRAIGVFDSGMGGLSVLKDIRRAFPEESTFYFGDNKRIPYGQEPVGTIIRYTLECLDYLYEQGVKALVVACNTATAVALEAAQARYDVPVVGVIESTARVAAKLAVGRVGVMATQATVNSEAYIAALLAQRPELFVSQQACLQLTMLVESGELSGKKAETVVEGYLLPLRDQKVDTIVLGCTHYPFLRPVIARLAGPDVKIIESGPSVVETMSLLMDKGKLERAVDGVARHKMFTTGEIETFTRVAGLLWGEELPEVVAVMLEALI